MSKVISVRISDGLLERVDALEPNRSKAVTEALEDWLLTRRGDLRTSAKIAKPSGGIRRSLRTDAVATTGAKVTIATEAVAAIGERVVAAAELPGLKVPERKCSKCGNQMQYRGWIQTPDFWCFGCRHGEAV